MEEINKCYKIIIEFFCSNHEGDPDENIAINEAGSREKLLAYLCEHYITQKINEDLDGKTLWKAFKDFEDYIYSSHKAIKLKDIYSSQIYNWYYGNCIQYLTHLILQPQLYTTYNTLEPLFVHSVIRKIYDILITYHCPIDLKDYYDTTAYEYMEQMKATPGKTLYLENNQEVLLSLLLKHGDNIINVQRDILKIKVSRMRKKKKDAVFKIENWWFNIVNNPYHPVGLKMIKKRAVDFERKYFL